MAFVKREGRLQEDDWVRAGLEKLALAGIEAVRVEVLARDLGVSKGSFYWHFADRSELLEAMLARWRERETGWVALESEKEISGAERWGRLLEHLAAPEAARLDVAMLDWARGDARVAAQVDGVDEKRAEYIAQILSDIGFTSASAKEWSEMALLVYLGWANRATRDASFRNSNANLGHRLSQLVLAASAFTEEAHR